MEIINAQVMYSMLTPTLKSRIKAIDAMIEAEAKEGKDHVLIVMPALKDYNDIITHFADYGFKIIKNHSDENVKNITLYWGNNLDPNIEYKKEDDYLGYMDAFKMSVAARKNAEGRFTHKYYLNHYLEANVTDIDFIVSGTYLDNDTINLFATMETMQEAGYAVYFDPNKICIRYSCDPNKTVCKQKDIYDIYKDYFNATCPENFSMLFRILK